MTEYYYRKEFFIHLTRFFDICTCKFGTIAKFVKTITVRGLGWTVKLENNVPLLSVKVADEVGGK